MSFATTSTSTSLVDQSRPRWAGEQDPRPLAVHVWVPTGESPAPMILLSHGTGGAAEDLVWLAEPLRDAGYLVAAVDHHGNSYNDEYLVEGFAFVWERARDLSRVLDHMVASYEVDEQRIGAAGFSLGGYTVAAILGARLNPVVLEAMFNGVIPAPDVPEFPAMVETLRRAYSPEQIAEIVGDGSGTFADQRVRAGFLIAPGAGLLIEPESLREITAPVEVRWGDIDDNCPPDENALVFVRELPNARGQSVGPTVGHYEFLGDREDPTGVRPRVAADAVRFFEKALR